jgi:hypothetical protein
VSYLFLFRAYPDIDHMSPLAWKLLEAGEEVHAVVSPGYDPSGDHRLEFLASHERFHLHAPWRRRGPLAMLCATFPYALYLLLRCRARLLAVEWGSGPRVSGIGSPGAPAAIARRLASSILAARRPDPQQVRANLILGATLLRRPVVALPHGVSVKLAGLKLRDPEANGATQWADRNRFALCAYESREHLEMHLEHKNGDPSILEALGSLRWSPQWFELNREIAPSFAWPEADDGRLRVLLMAPKWRKRVDVEATRDLLRTLCGLDFVSLAVKGHPRKAGSLKPLEETPGVAWSEVHDVSRADSVPLIDASDVVIDVGSSIGLEVVMQGKVLLNPAFIHELTTVFDELDGSCVRAESVEQVASYLRRHHEGSPHVVGDEVMAELQRRCVYAGSAEPYDVPSRYAERVRALAEPA